MHKATSCIGLCTLVATPYIPYRRSSTPRSTSNTRACRSREYGMIKVLNEEMVEHYRREYGLKTTIIRPRRDPGGRRDLQRLDRRLGGEPVSRGEPRPMRSAASPRNGR